MLIKDSPANQAGAVDRQVICLPLQQLHARQHF
jgi:hypothetical protein